MPIKKDGGKKTEKARKRCKNAIKKDNKRKRTTSGQQKNDKGRNKCGKRAENG